MVQQQGTYGIVVQARASSARLPGKVLMDIDGQPMLLRQANRLRRASQESVPLIIATSDHLSDDPIEELCNANEINCFRGPLDDVMLRFIQCAKEWKLNNIIRVGGDDPLIDPDCCEYLISLHRENPSDLLFASNRDGWPYGCAAELISVEALESIHEIVDDAFYREHTIPYFFDHPDDFSIVRVKAPRNINRPDYYFTVDYAEDLELIRTIFGLLRNRGNHFGMDEVIEIIDKTPEIRDINRHLHTGFDH